jgi:UDP-N-acetylglucosamine 2-epimerase (non-hydrolysing)
LQSERNNFETDNFELRTEELRTEVMKILSVFGTRPEAIKLAPVIAELRRHADVASEVCVTAQHREMLDQVLGLFGITPDYDLNLMERNQTPSQVASAVLRELERVLRGARPDWVLVQGDTTTVAAAALAAFYARSRVGHVEAGLRSHDKWRPFPEEINRRVAGVIADLHFAPTERARQNLLREGVPEAQVVVTGNTVIDALRSVEAQPWDPAALGGRGRELEDAGRRLVLVTAHRRENFGAPIDSICQALGDLAGQYGDALRILYPVHPNPNIREPVHRLLGGLANVILTPPLEYLQLVHLMKRSRLILTDSGGIQEEAPALGVPVLVLREVTERPEAVESGNVRLVGSDRQRIVTEARRLLDDPREHERMARAVNPYGDGHAAERIVGVLRGQPVEAFQAPAARSGGGG